MSDATAESSAPHEVVRPRDLTLWPYASTRRSPLWIGLAIALVFVVLTVGLHEFMLFLGYEPLRFFSAEVRIGAVVINGLLLGYIPTANAFLVVIVVTSAFLQPVVGVRRRIRAAKRADLERIHDALRLERKRLLEASPKADEPRPRMADLVAYRSLVQSVREWPFDVSSLARFLLFGALGVGSWPGGALVERLLDVLL